MDGMDELTAAARNGEATLQGKYATHNAAVGVGETLSPLQQLQTLAGDPVDVSTPSPLPAPPADDDLPESGLVITPPARRLTRPLINRVPGLL